MYAQEAIIAHWNGQWTFTADLVNVANLALENATDTTPEFIVDSFTLRSDTVINLYGHYRDTAGVGVDIMYIENTGPYLTTMLATGDQVSYFTCTGDCSVCDKVKNKVECKCSTTGSCDKRTFGNWPADGLSNEMRTILMQ